MADSNPNRNRQWEKAYHRLRNYGLTQEAYDAMLADQQNRCRICGGNWGSKGPCVDHDHETKRVRGLLCQPCNIALHYYERLLEDPDLTETVFHYLYPEN